MNTILFVHNNNDLYGAEVILLELIARLDRSKFHPIVVLPKDTAHINRLSARLQQLGIEFCFVRMGVIRRKYFTIPGVFRFFRELCLGVWHIRKIVKDRDVSIVHSNTVAVLAGAFAARICGKPHVWHVHEILVRPIVARKIVHFLLPRLSDRVVAVSQAVRTHVVADCPSKAAKVQVIHNGISLEKFQFPGGRERLRRQFQVRPDEVLVGMVGKVSRWKGQLVFAEAATRVVSRVQNVRFVAVGGVFDDETHYMDAFKEAVGRLNLTDRFLIEDFRVDVPDVLCALDVFVLPSTLPDPFPTVVLEAMASAKPVIATAHGGPCEMIVEGETGYLVEPGSPDALGAAIIDLVRNPELAKSMGLAGRKRAWQQFHFQRFVREFDELYTTLISGHENDAVAEPVGERVSP